MGLSLSKGGINKLDKFFWIRTGERALKTFAQALVTLLVSDHAFNFFSVNWNEALGAALFATLLSLLTSVASAQVGEKGSPSLVESKIEEQVLERAASGEPVGDPEKVVEPAFVEPIVVDEPVKAAPRKRLPRKNTGL